MSALHDALTEYLETRRALGTQLAWPASSLRHFVDFMEAEAADFVTTEIAVRWAVQSVGVQRATHARRLGIVRGFATWLQATDPRTQIPPPRILPARQRRPIPHIYSAYSGQLGHAFRRTWATIPAQPGQHDRSKATAAGGQLLESFVFLEERPFFRRMDWPRSVMT